MSLEEKVKKIEKELFDVNEDSRIDEALGNADANAHDIVELKEQIPELNKRITKEYNKLLWIKMIPYREWFWTLKNSIDKQIDELKEDFKIKRESDRMQINANLEAICWIRKLVLKLNKQKVFFWQLKDSIEKLEKKYKELFKTVHGIYPDKVDIYEETMRKHLKSHIVVAREQLTDKDKLTIFREFDEAIQKQLEKLEGDSKGLTLPQMREQLRFIRATMGDPEVYNENGTLKDGEKDVEEMSNKNLCREESNNDILPSSKPYEPLLKKDAVIELEDKCKDCLAHQFDEEFGHMCISPLCIKEYDYDVETRIWSPKKEPTDDLEHEHQYDFNYDCIECGKNLLEIIERSFLTTEFDSHNTHKIVQKVTLEGWKSKVQNYTSDNSIDSYNRLFSIIQEIDQYLVESEEK